MCASWLPDCPIEQHQNDDGTQLGRHRTGKGGLLTAARLGEYPPPWTVPARGIAASEASLLRPACTSAGAELPVPSCRGVLAECIQHGNRCCAGASGGAGAGKPGFLGNASGAAGGPLADTAARGCPSVHSTRSSGLHVMTSAWQSEVPTQIRTKSDGLDGNLQ